MKPQRFLNHSQIDVYFKQSKDDFVVNEVPLYEFSNEGEHLILKLRKKDLATWDAIEILANYLKCSTCLLYTSPSPRDRTRSRMPSSA